jgi:hypothetical protein
MIIIVACRSVAGQRPRDKQIYNKLTTLFYILTQNFSLFYTTINIDTFIHVQSISQPHTTKGFKITIIRPLF